MSDCPRCFHELEENRSDGGVSWQCPDCGGLLATLPFLRRRLSVEAANRIWQTARESEPGSSSRECPFCGKDMVRVRSEFDGHDIELDACLPCQAFWFDRGEIDALPEAPPPPPSEPEPELSDEAREKLAAAQMRLIQERAESDPSLGESSGEETIGLPSPNGLPWATWLILLVSVGAWIGEEFGSSSRDRGFWILLIFLIGDMWNFSPAVEAEIGGWRLLGMWAVSAALAGAIHWNAGCEAATFPLVAFEAMATVVVWLSLRFPTARVVCRDSRWLRWTTWIPLPFHALCRIILCLLLPFRLDLDGRTGSPLAVGCVAAVGVAFHFAGRRQHRDPRGAR